MPSVLIVDDLLSIHEMLGAVIQPTGFQTAFATDGEKALARYKTEKFDLVLADIDMKPMDGITLLKQLKAYDPNAIVVIMTAYASTESAVQALKFGAFDYLQKPFRVDELIATLRRGIEFKDFQSEQAASGAASAVKQGDIEARIVGQSAVVRRLIQQIRKLAAARTPVLLMGEAGTGKLMVAELLHEALGATDNQFIRVDCALASEAHIREGLLGENGEGGNWVRQAKGGTLFLQHLEHLSLAAQKELVSVLRNTAHGFRLICATTVDLELLTDEGKFHDELFYRVASLPVHMPSLRERIEDLPLLVKHYASQATNPNFDASLIEFTDDTLAILATYRWPGNLAELNQVVSQIAATTDTRIVTSEQLPLRLREMKSWPTLAEYLAQQEAQYREMVLHACRGDKAAAEKILGVPL
ncbi:MAG: sigma-54 dependent transcriptional regulator [Opitutus sp.]|nr:sigma-54 dependent transcriptional regulator [Opitutus sp.]